MSERYHDRAFDAFLDANYPEWRTWLELPRAPLKMSGAAFINQKRKAFDAGIAIGAASLPARARMKK